jgi:hypothetical protein
VKLDVSTYQSFAPDDQAIWKTNRLHMDGIRKSERWSPLNVHVVNPVLPEGDVFRLCAGAIVTNAKATEQLRDFLEMAGELLPLRCNNQEFHLLNATECTNALDRESTRWESGLRTGANIRIIQYVFHPDRLSESSLFKIPETRKGEILTVEGRFDPEDEFKFRVEQASLKGLMFEEVWRDEE